MTKLYSYARSSAAYRVRIALNLKGVAYEIIPKHLLRDGGEHRKSDYLALNPQGLIPALDVGGERVIPQSFAILEYLEEAYPSPPLLPATAVDRALVRAMVLNVVADLHPLNNLRILSFLRSELGQDQAAVDLWYHHWVVEGLRALEEQARRFSGDGQHAFGTSVTLADVVLVPQMFNARRFNCDTTAYPTLVGIASYLETLPAFVQATPDKQPDFKA